MNNNNNNNNNRARKNRGLISGLPADVASHLSKDGADWLVSALDPFHDFERSIEGAPDMLSSKSFTRRYNQTLTVSALAEDDYISIDYFGGHGVKNNYEAWGPDAYPDEITSSGWEVYPIHILRTPAVTGAPSLGMLAGTASTLGGFVTTQSPTIPSRIISMGLEVVDVTPSLYKKGVIQCSHVNGAVQHLTMNGTITDMVLGSTAMRYAAFAKPSLPINSTQMAALPGSYIGKLSDGIYTQARLGEVQSPTQSDVYQNNGALSGSFLQHQVLGYADEVAPRSELYQPTFNTGDQVKATNFYIRHCTADSGFQPFRILISGVAESTTLQVTVRITVEYFPTPTHPFECGIATLSPAYDPYAFLAYHAIISQIPYGVPVSMNAKGDFWRMVWAAATKAGAFLRQHAPMIAGGVGSIATALGHPEVAAIAQAVAKAIPPRSGASRQVQVQRKQK